MTNKIETIQPKQGIWRTYDVTDGLPGGVQCLLQDRQAYLWLGMNSEGFCRYDGAEFTTYTTDDGLADNGVMAICEDSKGNLWFGTPDGVSCFDGQRFTNYTTDDGLADNHVGAILEDSQGRLWFGTWGTGVSCFDGQRFTNYNNRDGLAGNYISTIYEDQRGLLWFGTGPMLTFYVGGISGVSSFDGQIFTTYTIEDGLVNNNVTAICEDRQGHLWFGTWGGGVSCFDGQQFLSYTTENGLLGNRVDDIIQDREGNLWFCHSLSGLTQFNTETIQLLTEEPVSEILIQDGQDHFWFGNMNKLCCLFEGRQSSQQINATIYSLLEDSRGHFWVGTGGDGFYYYDSTDAVWNGGNRNEPEYSEKQFTTEDGLVSNSVMILLESRDGKIWLGTTYPGCLCQFDGKIFEAIPTPHPVIFRLFEDRQGRIWIGGYWGGGLSCYDGKRLVTYTIDDGLPNDSVTSIVEDDVGNLWIGTQQGLCCFDGKRFIPYGKEQGLFNLMHQCSAKDTKGQLWFGTLVDGLYRYDGKHFQWLTTEDGLPSNSITGLVPQPDGSMIIGTYRGIVHYHPTAILPPAIEIREVVADQVYQSPSELELTTTEADLLTISYHGLSFATRQMRYSYILEGYHPHQSSALTPDPSPFRGGQGRKEREENLWQDTWDNQVRYEHLPEGEYTFKVIAINRDLVPSEEPAILKLTIVPDPRDHQIAELESELARRNRELEAELQDAHDVQMSLMPQTAPPIEGLEIAGKCVPANTVSGDFFDYLESKRKNEIGLVIADVCGKAMKGAMNAVMTDGILHAKAEEMENLSPASLMMKVNNILKARMERYMNVTMVIAVIHRNRSEGETILTLANAAHHAYPLLLRLGLSRNEVTYRNQGDVQPLKTGGLPLGMRAGIEYSEEQFPLQSGDVVIFMTDGIIEAQNSEGKLYSESGRLEETISKFTLDLSAKAMVDAILNDVLLFSGDKTTRDDDMTVVVAKVM